MVYIVVPPFEPDPLQLMYVQIADHIAARITAGDLPGGQRLPPERDLATHYRAAYSTIRKSMGLLRERGLIVTMHGRGTYVIPADQRPPYTAPNTAERNPG